MCHVCGEHSHLAAECSKRETTPKSQWWSTKFQQFTQTEQEEAVEAAAVAEPTSQGNKSSSEKQGWCKLQMCKETENKHCLTQQSGKDIDFNEVVLLDTGSTFSAMKNKKPIAGVKQTNDMMDMNTNAGSRPLCNEGQMPGLEADAFFSQFNGKCVGFQGRERPMWNCAWF